MVLLIHDSLLIPSYFPRCHPLSPPQTPHVTPPTPVGPSTPPAAPKQVSHRRLRLWSAPNPASAPRCSPLFVASPQYTLNPRSAAGRDPRRPPMPEFPARREHSACPKQTGQGALPPPHRSMLECRKFTPNWLVARININAVKVFPSPISSASIDPRGLRSSLLVGGSVQSPTLFLIQLLSE
ncbi:hypothetical protein PGTUg99_005337 [Puccinia graminis f. sp. tritici]|uniref:Uncharacterized protein n=1 Tax=Puccinia graminis f. sp. tritici TaxID=56615 RepID=A0A5B0RWU1_PUCGR|nr:hypothetical protein PGTUg99_005337 [Puccinia graminis f. sp. tritici]